MSEVFVTPYTGTGEPQFKTIVINDAGQTTIHFHKTIERAEKSVSSARAHGWKANVEPTTAEEKQKWSTKTRFKRI